ncbi:MAG: type II secretion system minor pseudopilin GspK [Syntrophales bacterium]|nr:type II secretion system minor pseudopilin GspK [Syntrophales bacterium]
MALVLTLMIMAIITAMVVEFSYDVYTTNASLYNWRTGQQLSLAAKSGITLAVKSISDNQALYTYTYPGKVEIPVEKMFSGSDEEFGGKVFIRVEDENAKFNLNALVWPNGETNEAALASFKRLLKKLQLDEQIAYNVADWIDHDSEPRSGDSEQGTKNSYMDSADELRLIRGFDSRVYETLEPFITVYGVGTVSSSLVNINSAPLYVIMSLDDNMTEQLAERIVKYRDLEPFQRSSDLVKVAGFEGPLGQSLMGKVVVKAENLRITSVAEDNNIKRVIECVVGNKDGGFVNKYWREI